MLRNIILKFCDRIFNLSMQYKTERLRKIFKIPDSASVYNVSLEGHVEIGAFTYINEGSRINSGDRSRVLIGKHCAIGRYVHITSKTHDNRRPTTDENYSDILHKEADVSIGSYVWIGDQAIILPGVRISDHAIIGAQSVVVSDVRPFEVVGGVPARHIKFNTEHYQYKA